MEQPGGRRNLSEETQVSSSHTSSSPGRRAACEQVLGQARAHPEHTAPGSPSPLKVSSFLQAWLCPDIAPRFQQEASRLHSDLSLVHLRCPSSQGDDAALMLPRTQGFSRAQLPLGCLPLAQPCRLPAQPAVWGENEAAHTPTPFITASSPPPGWQGAENRQQLWNQPGGLC